jgi:hypothetical protein
MLIKYGNNDVTNRLLSYKLSVSFSDGCMIGNVPSAQLEVKFDNYDGILDNLDLDIIWETQENDSSKKRYFKIYDQPEKYTKELTLKMYDCNYQLDIAYDTKLSYPVTIKDQLDEIEALTGLSIKRDNIPSYVLKKSVAWYDNTIVIRNYLGWIAELFGANVFADEKETIKFVPLSKTAYASTQDIVSYEKNEDYTLTRIYAENGMNPLEKGDETGNSLFVDGNNLYCDDQSIIDQLYTQLSGITFSQVQSVSMISIDDLEPGCIINYNDEFNFFVTDLSVEFKGGEFSMSTVDGTVSTKNEEKIINKVTNTQRIRKLQVQQDQESLKLDIIAKEQEGINDKVAQLSLSNEKISLRVSEVEEKAGEAIKQAQGSVKKFVCEYASSNDGTIPPETGWSETAPTWHAGIYIWQRTATTINNTVTYSTPVCITGAKGEDAILLYIDSSNGNLFKNTGISTTLTVTIIIGHTTIDNSEKLEQVFGSDAYLQWLYKPLGSNDYITISRDDTRLSDGGFIFTISPGDVDTKTVFSCELNY